MSSFNRIFSWFWIGLVFITAPLSGEEKKPEPAQKKITFDEHVLPIFRAKCNSCHNPGDQKGGLNLDSYQGTMTGGGSGEVIETGDPAASYLYLLVTHESEPVMPPNQPKIPAEELAIIKQWIELGALENQGSKPKPKKKNELAKVVISSERPASAPVFPESVPYDPPFVTSMPNSVTALANSPWASLAAVSGHRQVSLYHTQSGELTGVLPFPEGNPEIIRFSRNGELLLVGGGRGGASGKVVIFDVKTGLRKAEIGSEYDSVLAADISADHTQVVLAGPKRMIRVYSVATGELMYEIKKHTDWILAAEFSPDGVLLATADRSNGLFIWEALTGNEYLAPKGHSGPITDLSWRPDSNVLASCSKDGTIRLWELNDGREIKRWGAHGGGVSALEFTRDARLVSIGRDKAVKVWQADGKNLKSLGGLPDLGMEVAYDSELNRVLGGDWSGEVRIWDANSGQHLYTLKTNPPSLNDQIKQVDAQVATASKAVTSSQQALAALAQQLKARQEAAQKTKSQWEAMGKQVASVQNEANKINGSVAPKKKNLAQLGGQVQDQQKKRDQAKADVQNTQKQLADAGQKLKAAQENQAKLTQAMKAAEQVALVTDAEKKQQADWTQQITANQAKLQKLQEELKKLETAPQTTQAENSPAAQEQIENLKKQIEETTKAIQALQNNLNALNQKIAARQKAAQTAKQQLDAAVKQTAAAQGTVDQLNKAMKEKQTMLAGLEKAFQERVKQRDQVQQDLQNTEKQLAAANKKLNDLKQQHAKLKQEFDKAQKASPITAEEKKKQDSWNQTVASQQARIQHLQARKKKLIASRGPEQQANAK